MSRQRREGEQIRKTPTETPDLLLKVIPLRVEQGHFVKNPPAQFAYFLKALSIQERILGANHPDTVQMYFNLGELYTASGKHAKALLYRNKAKQNPAFKKRPDSMVNHCVKNIGRKRKKKK